MLAYILKGYKRRNAYIATQTPLSKAVDDLWRMMWEFKSEILVNLCQPVEGDADACHQFWPTAENETMKFGIVSVTLQSVTNYEAFVVRRFDVCEKKVYLIDFGNFSIFYFQEFTINVLMICVIG